MLDIQHFSFRIGDKEILSDLSLSVLAGERVGIIGPNGSGKTTLFNCISGYNRPQKGELYLDKENITYNNPSVRASKGLGRMFQNSGIFHEMTVGENVQVALESKHRGTSFLWGLRGGISKSELKEQIYTYLKRVGLDEKINDKAGSLSGGQLRLLEVIRLIAFDAKVFLLDEPTAGVSPKMKGEIISTLGDIIPEDAVVLLIEHDINFLKQYCERAVVLNQGTIALDGPVDEVRADNRLQDIYFGT